MKFVFKDCENLRKCTAEPYWLLVFDTTLLSNYALRFQKNLLEEVWRVAMTIDEKIRDEKLQYEINRAAAKVSALSSNNIDNLSTWQSNIE